MQDSVAALGDDLTPLAFLMSVYRDRGLPIELRVHAASKAAPFMHRSLKSVEQPGVMMTAETSPATRRGRLKHLSRLSLANTTHE